MKYIKNNTLNDKTWLGKVVAPGAYYLIPTDKESYWSSDSSVLVDIANQEAIMAKTDDGNNDLTSISTAFDFLKNMVVGQIRSVNYPFADKCLPDGRKLYTRVHGISAQVAGAPDNITFTVPYPVCKLTGIQILNGELGDSINFKILDKSSAPLYGVPNALLNQFGFNVKVNGPYYKYDSEYDADLVQDMQIRLEYDAITSDLLPKTVYINFILHEVV